MIFGWNMIFLAVVGLLIFSLLRAITRGRIDDRGYTIDRIVEPALFRVRLIQLLFMLVLFLCALAHSILSLFLGDDGVGALLLANMAVVFGTGAYEAFSSKIHHRTQAERNRMLLAGPIATIITLVLLATAIILLLRSVR